MLLSSLMTRTDILWLMLAMATFFVLVLFLGFVTYLRQRRAEREAYYRFELRKKAIEAGVSADTLLEMQRQDEAASQRRTVDGLRLGGLIAAVSGVALVALAKMSGDRDTLAVAFLPVVVGVSFLGYAQWRARRGGGGG